MRSSEGRQMSGIPPSEHDLDVMGAALLEAEAAANEGEIPVGALILGLAAFYVAGYGIKRLRLLLFLLIASFLLVLISEFVGRTIFYEAMTRVGV